MMVDRRNNRKGLRRRSGNISTNRLRALISIKTPVFSEGTLTIEGQKGSL